MMRTFNLPLLLVGISALVTSSHAYGLPPVARPPIESRICSGGCAQDFDVVFILDRSNQVSSTVFNNYLESINAIIDVLDFGKVTTHVGLVAFNDEAKVLKKLNENNNAQFLKDFVSGSIQQSGGQDIGKALSVARLDALDSANGNRAGVENVCVLYTTADAASDGEYALLEDLCQVIVFADGGGQGDATTFSDEVCPSAGSSTGAVYTLPMLNCTAELCCMNLGEATLAFNGCCKCSCLPPYTGTYCDDETTTDTIEFGTYQNGNNLEWDMELTSTDTNHPIGDILFGSNAGDPHDNYGSFARGDLEPKLTINLNGPGKNKLHYIEGQLTSRTNGLAVRVKFFNEDVRVNKVKINLANGGPGDYPELDYQNFRIDMNGQFVTKIRFDFKDLEGKRGEVGINNLFGVYTKAVNGTVNQDCSSTSCGYGEDPQWINGCCKCVSRYNTTPPNDDDDSTPSWV